MQRPAVATTTTLIAMSVHLDQTLTTAVATSTTKPIHQTALALRTTPTRAVMAKMQVAPTCAISQTRAAHTISRVSLNKLTNRRVTPTARTKRARNLTMLIILRMVALGKMKVKFKIMTLQKCSRGAQTVMVNWDLGSKCPKAKPFTKCLDSALITSRSLRLLVESVMHLS